MPTIAWSKAKDYTCLISREARSACWNWPTSIGSTTTAGPPLSLPTTPPSVPNTRGPAPSNATISGIPATRIARGSQLPSPDITAAPDEGQQHDRDAAANEGGGVGTEHGNRDDKREGDERAEPVGPRHPGGGRQQQGEGEEQVEGVRLDERAHRGGPDRDREDADGEGERETTPHGVHRRPGEGQRCSRVQGVADSAPCAGNRARQFPFATMAA